ncbi:MAG: tyrosine--tRNA ligase, partial [Nanoarchaeota archaeon]|nr:tyrosine--tRNA ligase [Nanoarchaeota archaeon]
ELTIGEDVIYHKLREKEKTNPLVNRIKDNLLFQKSGRDFEYPLKLFYGQMHKAIFKIGIDPTTPDLHLGHTVPLQVAKEFQDLGCYITVIIGDLTAAIGDPSGRPDARKTLPYEEIRNNVAEYESQVSKILRRGKTNFIYNSSWLKPLRADCLDQLLFNFKEYDIMQRRDFQKRVSTSLTRGETTYPIYQATDSATIGSAWELGGQDQLINMMLGRRLQQKLDIESQMLLFTPLLVGIYGKEKMSKSLNNCIALNDSPKEIYQKIMNLPDYLVYDYYLLLTSEKEIFKNVPEDKRGDLFAAFGGLNLIQDYGGRIVRENEIRLSGDIETILKRIEEGNGDGLKENKYLQSGDIDLLKDLIFTLDREIKSHEKRKRGELHLKDYKPDYTIIADHRDKEEPLKIIAGKEDDITQAVLYEFMLYEKKTDGSVYDPRNLKERLAKHLVLKYHGREGLEEVYKLQEEILMQETTRRGGKPLKYINLDDYTHGGKLRIPSLFKRGFGMGVEAVAKKAEEGLVTLDGVPVHFKKSLGRKGGTFYTPNFQFGPGSHELIIGSKANPLERVYSVARGPKT